LLLGNAANISGGVFDGAQQIARNAPARALNSRG